MKIAPATTPPEQPPIDWMMTFCERASFFFATPDKPMAMIAIGIAASNTCPTFNPRYAAAAENNIVIKRPMVTDQTVIS